MIVYKVEARHIDVIWPYAEPLLQKPMKRTLGEIQLEDIKNWLKGEEQQLWLGIDEHKQEIILAITTQIYVYPQAITFTYTHGRIKRSIQLIVGLMNG